jgi:hypothetical protein
VWFTLLTGSFYTPLIYIVHPGEVLIAFPFDSPWEGVVYTLRRCIFHITFVSLAYLKDVNYRAARRHSSRQAGQYAGRPVHRQGSTQAGQYAGRAVRRQGSTQASTQAGQYAGQYTGRPVRRKTYRLIQTYSIQTYGLQTYDLQTYILQTYKT